MKFITKIREQIRSNNIAKDDIYLATDDDREGEAISWHLAKALNLDPKTAKRMRFHSVTATAITHAVKNPDHIDQNRVDSALARQVTDKVVGYELSPILWRQIGRGLSAGRVQSVVTRMVVDLERELAKFASKSFFAVEGFFGESSVSLESKTKNEIKAVYNSKPDSYDLAKSLMESFKQIPPSNYEIYDITSNKSQRHPSAPFITSSLQQECSNRFSWAPKLTMSLAQSLYEKGLITYMRTDSTVLSKEAFELSKTIIVQKYGNDYYHGKQYNNSQGSQEAHEAIRPTDLNVPQITGESQEVKLYDLIWKRTIASQMSAEEVLTTTYIITAVPTNTQNVTKNLGYFVHKRAQTTFPGFKILYIPLKSDADDDEENTKFPYDNLAKGTKLLCHKITANQGMTEPDGRYTEASLIRKIEKDEIGRPSTFHSILDKIQQKGYVVKKTIPGISWPAKNITLTNRLLTEETVMKKTKTETNKLVPTDLGRIVTEFLEREFSEIMDYQFTASMEKGLDEVRQGQKVWQDLVRSYWDLLYPKLSVLKDKTAAGSERESRERLLGTDPTTGQKIYATIGPYGLCIRRDAKEISEDHSRYNAKNERIT